MAPFVKQLDSNHLLTVGEEGFWSTTADRLLDNPIYQPAGTNWARDDGQDFLADHSSPYIDFATFHSWIDNWKVMTGAPCLHVYYSPCDWRRMQTQ